MDKHEDMIDPELAAWLVGALLVLGAVGYLVAAWPLLVWTGGLPSIPDGVVAGARLAWHVGDPRGAYPNALAVGLPGPVGWWATVGLPALGCVGVLVVALVRVDGWRGRRRLGVRRYDPRGWVSPRSFARPRDLRTLRYEHGEDSWSLVRVDRREIGSGPESHVMAIGPSRSGKSVALATSWVVESPGAAIVTSTKRELIESTGPGRARVGPCRIYAPLTPPGALPVPAAGWSPLRGCEDWDQAQLVAHWLGDAAPVSVGGGGEQGDAARFWNAEAAKVLAVLLHAAELDPERYSMADVVQWADGGPPALAEPLETVQAAGHRQAALRLEGLLGQDSRTQSYTLVSAGQLVAAYRFEAAQASEHAPHQIDVDELLAGHGTLYLLAPESRQPLVAPLFAALLGEVFRAIEEHDLTVGAMDPPVRFVLDEAAHLAALSSLPERLALTAGQGVRIASLWQSFAQIEQRYGKAAPTIVANSHARLVLGPVSDEPTRRLMTELLDEEPARRRSRHAGRWGAGRTSTTVQETRERKASAQALQQLPRFHGLAVVHDALPVIGRVAPWTQRPAVRKAIEATVRQDIP